MLDFTITYADVSDRRSVRREIIAAVDIDRAASVAVETCPAFWFVARVEQTDMADDLVTCPECYAINGAHDSDCSRRAA